MKNLFLVVILSLTTTISFSQYKSDTNQEIAVEGSFVGGIDGLTNFLAENVKYPQIDIDNKTSGKVYTSLLINEKGEVEKIEILRGISPTLDEEAIRICKKMPNWIPAKDAAGKPISSKVTLPIYFRMD